jgi:hypothetical protein
MKLKVIAALSLATLLVSCGGGGPGSGGPQFTGGIYLVTSIYHTQTNVLVAQKGVGVQGNLASQDQTSCSNNGTQTLFGGTTEKHGVYNCPQCQVNAVWNMIINYNLVVGACMNSSLQQVTIDFPCGGAVQPFQCNL